MPNLSQDEKALEIDPPTLPKHTSYRLGLMAGVYLVPFFLKIFKNFILSRLSPNTFFAAMIIFHGMASLGNREALVCFLTLALFLYLIYRQTLSSCQGLHASRDLNANSFVEMDKLKVTWSIKNGSSINIHYLEIIDQIGLSQNAKIRKDIVSPPNAHSQIIIKENFLVDGGMGIRSVGPLKLKVKDMFHIFEFEIVLPKIETYEVTPKVVTIVSMPPETPLQSLMLGPYGTPMLGQNINFKGIRPYRYGDSLRHIAWKKSAKTGELNVKIFESDINSDVGIILNLDPRGHVGRKAKSTWEKSRDIAISLISGNLEKGHRVGFLTNNFSVELNQGDEHFYSLAKKISLIGNMDEENNDMVNALPSIEQLLDGALISMVRCHSIYLVTPKILPQHHKILEFARKIRVNKTKLYILFIDPLTFLNEVPLALKKFADKDGLFFMPKEWNDLQDKLCQTEAQISLVGLKDKIPNLFSKKAAS